MKTCCFTGHRPKFFPWKDNLSDPRAQRLLSRLRREIEQAIADGFTTFLCGGAIGVDTWAAQIVLELNQKLILALPFPGYNSASVGSLKAEIVIVGNRGGVPGFTARDHYMIDHSQRLIAVYDERTGIKSGTYRALEYAREKGIEIRQIRWLGDEG